jgi:hypothetical protein
MKRSVNFIALAALVLGVVAVAFPGPAAAQDLHPSRRPSPMGMARTTVDDTYISVVYSRPYKRGRDNIFGTEESEALVPYGKIWRTGANEATQMTVTGDVMIGKQKLPAGTYSVFTTPGADSWKIHFNTALGLSGTGFFDPVEQKFTPADLGPTDLVVISATPGVLKEEVEQLTFAFDDTAGGADMCLRWITTEVCVPVKVAGN